MARTNTATIGTLRRERSNPDALAEAALDSSSAVSWSSIFAGAAGAAALSLILLMLGTGLGLSSVSPWAHDGISKTTFGVSTILWVSFTQLVASGMGGYLAGRLRTRWIEVQRDEIYFRDTVHGFLAWAVSSLVTAALLTSVVASITNSSVQAGPTAAGTITTTDVTAVVGSESARPDGGTGSLDYFIDSLFRREATVALTATAQAADAARKASAYASLWLFIALLSGAFVASLAATAGGRQRDA